MGQLDQRLGVSELDKPTGIRTELLVELSFHQTKSWYYQTEKQLDGSNYQGVMNSYGGGGFVKVLTNDKTTSSAMIEDLFNNLWIDRATRVVFLDFTVYNANINLFCQVK